MALMVGFDVTHVLVDDCADVPLRAVPRNQAASGPFTDRV